MFECDRTKFIALKNLNENDAPSLQYLQDFYQNNFWRIDPFMDVSAVNCYERLYYFWMYYKDQATGSDSWLWIALFLGILIFSK